MPKPTPTPNPWLPEAPYSVPRHPAPLSLKLDGNEGIAPQSSLLESLSALSPEDLQRYPSPGGLEAKLAARFGLDAAQVVVTAGADEGLLRACRAFLGPGRNLVLPEPSFEMIRRFATSTQCEVRSVPYDTPRYPTDKVIAASDERTALIAVVSPNNPTGGVISADELRRLSDALPQAMLMVDLAYIEFADEDLTEVALSLPNALVFRTFSKARGLAGLRVGYAMGDARWVRLLRATGLPYPLSAPALRLAEASLSEERELEGNIRRLNTSRASLEGALQSAGLNPWPSQGNFVFAEGLDGRWWRDAMAGLGIGIRAWPEHPLLDDAIRISAPGSEAESARLTDAIATITSPEAILFDLDGVLADVSESYRRAIIESAADFGVTITQGDIEAMKAQGDANNDWVVTHRLVTQAGVNATLEDVTARFEARYQGSEGAEGLYLRERFIGPMEGASALASRFKLGIVTGRPRRDAERFLGQLGLQGTFEVLICMEDAKLKPSPEPVEAALSGLGVRRAWMLGDTPDDIVAAREAGVLPFGVLAPSAEINTSTTTLLQAGAARVFRQWDELLEVLS